MPKFNVDKAFWRAGVLKAVGEVVEMTKAEAKYLGHVISEIAAEVVAPVTAAAVDAASATPMGASVSEAPAKKKASTNGDASN